MQRPHTASSRRSRDRSLSPSRRAVTTDDVQTYLKRQADRYDERIERAYDRLSHMSPSPSKPPSRGRNGRSESPEAWFQHILLAKQLSPLDLCEIFCYGDSRRHARVPLGHVCRVMFDLDPQAALESDGPVTEAMENFLYKFSSHDPSGEICVDIKDALRSLNIWQSRGKAHSPGKSTADTYLSTPTQLPSDSPAKTIILESKNQKLLGVISSLQNDNLRLSQQLKAVKTETKSKHLSQSLGSWPSKSSQSSPNKTQQQSKCTSKVVNPHEKQLLDIANALEYTGVKQLEDLLKKSDPSDSGFLSLKHIRWILSDQFRINVSETHLMELCMGLNFNAQAKLDYKELVHVLLDMLIYGPLGLSPVAKSSLVLKIQQYLQSGFSPDAQKNFRVLAALCENYDLEGNGCISIAEALRIFLQDLVSHHALRLPFPIEEQELLQFLNRFVVAQTEVNQVFISYTKMLDAIFDFKPIQSQQESSQISIERALDDSFWKTLCKALCSGDKAAEPQIRGQLCKILAKLDPKRTFIISQCHFHRIFEMHLDVEDLELIYEVLSVPHEKKKDRAHDQERVMERLVRYDVFLRLVFGEPRLLDHDGMLAQIHRKLVLEQTSLRTRLTDLMKVHGGGWTMTMQDLHELLVIKAEKNPLSMVQALYLAGDLNVEGLGLRVTTLWTYLTRSCWQKYNPETANDSSEKTTKTLLARCLGSYSLHKCLGKYEKRDDGWISQDSLVAELKQMTQTVALDHERLLDINHLRSFVQQLTAGTAEDDGPRLFSIHVGSFFESLFDWALLIRNMQLPHALSDAKKALELFDWQRDGSITTEDWNKAWRQINPHNRGMAEWEIQVLLRRFTSKRSDSEAIDYARLLVFLLDFDLRQAQTKLKAFALSVFQRKSMRPAEKLSTAYVEKLFQQLDSDGKGHFNSSDLQQFLSQEIQEHDHEMRALVQNAGAVGALMEYLAGKPKTNRQTVVSFDRFRELITALSRTAARDQGEEKPGWVRHFSTQDNSPIHERLQIVTSLRALELAVLEISRQISDAYGLILPSKVYRYLSLAGKPVLLTASSSSPLRSSSPTMRSMVQKQTQREVEAMATNPLTPSGLKQTLRSRHNLQVSSHLVSQFFLHIGAGSKYFLDLLPFAKWLAPLSKEMTSKVRAIVTKMLVQGKAGGGRIDLDRFLAQLHRRLMGSPSLVGSGRWSSSKDLDLDGVHFVRPAVLVSKLQQLNIPINRQDMDVLLRHFGMEEQEEIDYALFLQRLYELSAYSSSF